MTWVLLRGLMREQRHWGNFTQQFAQAHPHERIITLDFAGNGALYQQASATSIGAMVEQARGQVQQQLQQQAKARSNCSPSRSAAWSRWRGQNAIRKSCNAWC
jgi:hypothetical protein